MSPHTILSKYCLCLLLGLLAAPSVIAAGLPTLLSRTASGQRSNGPSEWIDLSGDGRYAVFSSRSTDLAVHDPDGLSDIFLYDVAADSLRRITQHPDTGVGANSSCFNTVTNHDGRYVAFSCIGGFTFVPGTLPGGLAIILLDRDTDADGIMDEPGTSSLRTLSVDSAGNTIAHVGWLLDMSADGRYVLFYTNARIAAGDNSSLVDVYLHDRDADEDGVYDETGFIRNIWVSRRSTQNFEVSEAQLSADGSLVVFSSTDPIDPDDTNALSDIYGFDVATETTTRLSESSTGASLNGQSIFAAVSATGRFVAFSSSDSTIDPSDTNGVRDVFLIDRQLNSLTRVTRDSRTSPENQGSWPVSISADGRSIIVRAGNPGLTGVAGAVSSFPQPYEFDTVTGDIRLLAVGSDGLARRTAAVKLSLSADHSSMLFLAGGDFLVAGAESHPVNFSAYLVSTAPDLRLDVDAARSPVHVGEAAVFNIAVTNQATVAATDAEVILSLPASASGASVNLAGANCSVQSASAVCAFPQILGIHTYSGQVQIPAVAVGEIRIEGQVVAAQTDAVPADDQDQASLLVDLPPAPDVTLSLVGPSSVRKGKSFTATYTVRNSGNATATAVSVHIDGPSNGSLQQIGKIQLPGATCPKVKRPPVRCTIASLAPGSVLTGRLTLKAKAVGTLTQRVVSALSGDSDTSNNIATLAVTVTK